MNKSSWSDEQIKQHQIAADLCCKIMSESFELIRKNPKISEYDVQQFILRKYQEYDMVCDEDIPIVAFRENTSFVHYFPEEQSAKQLEQNSLIMIDLWARLDQGNAPYADITWMAWHGDKIPSEIQKAFDIIIESRDSCVGYIKNHLHEEKLWNKDLAKSMEGIVLDSGLQELLPHSFGHSLGTTSPHGKFGVLLNNSQSALPENVGYTIEPGIYIENKYGFRSEIDFYIDQNRKLIVTTQVQKEIELI